MSPEQARGQELDGRSDIFSLGLVLYEMVTGRQAFTGETTAVIFDGILNRVPPAPSSLNPEVPPQLEQIIARAIEKDRAKRYASSGEMAADLSRLRRPADNGAGQASTGHVAASASGWPSPSATTGVSGAAGVPGGARRGAIPAGVLLIAAAAAGAGWWQLRTPAPVLGAGDTIIVADFDNSTGDAMFDGTLNQALAVKLEESPFLDVLADQHVRETLAFMSRPADTPVTQGVAREICQRRGIKAVMLGSIASLGSTYIVTLTAENCGTGDVLGREQATAATKEQVLAALGEVATRMRGRLGESLASIARLDTPIEQATTSSLEALKAFSLGDQKRNSGSDQEAIPFFRRAVELDPEFAMAWAQLGTIYSNLGERNAAIEHRKRAFELRDRVSERERLYITAHYYSGVANEPDKALETYEVWKQAYPRDAVPWINSGTIYAQRGEAERSLAAHMKALELDPLRRLGYANAFGKLIELKRLDEARALVQKQIELLGASPETELRMYEIAAFERKRDETSRYGHLEHGPVAANFLQIRAAEMAFYGRIHESDRLTGRLVELLRRQGLDDRAAAALSGQAFLAAFVKSPAAAREHVRAVAGLKSSLDYHANMAFAYAALGDAPRARRELAAVPLDGLTDPQMRDLFVQSFEGLLALQTGRPEDTVAQLASIPQDRLAGPVMHALLVRADGLRALGQLDAAARDYRLLLAGPQPAPFSLVYPLARVGLARTLAASGDLDGARAEYRQMLDLWKEADPDLPIVQQVRAEGAKLGS
jgi:tetratricopeptide (TPR) repeat protein